ncbi:RNA-binding protein [Rothia nasimurium]|uniref:RNA-binding protein n=1 Tax=Rothia nasimurium TaxID=85336 RepID=UPI001F25E533|nr:RNA-binding protein [Rothia nasimurium]
MEVNAKSGLLIPEDINQWRKWQQSVGEFRNLKRLAKRVSLNSVKHNAPSHETVFVNRRRGEGAQALVALDSANITSLKSLIDPLEFVANPVVVISTMDVHQLLPGEEWTVEEVDISQALSTISPRLIISAGHYLMLGALTFKMAQELKVPYAVSQHGLITPFAPPLPSNSHLLAFSQADAEFWISGRSDLTYDVVGSQLFWEAAQKPKVELPEEEQQPIFLGQMHGAELPRRSYARAGFQFCQQTGARYRPHPNEKDKLSVLTHALWEKMGIAIDRGGEPLNTLTNPVVSIFSTGVLEAAIRGVPAWVYHPNPPAWVQEFWERYGLHQWEDTPTPAPAVPAVPPAQVIAAYLEEKLQ